MKLLLARVRESFVRPLFGFRTCVAAALFGLVAGAVLPLTAQNQEEEDLYSYAMEGVLEEVERLLEEGVRT